GVGLLLAVTGLLAWRRRPRETLPAAAVATLALLFALGTPLNALLYFGIPGFSQSGSPARILVLFCFAGAWLAALGAQALTEAAPTTSTDSAARNAGLPGGDGSADLPVGESAGANTNPMPPTLADRKVGAPTGHDETPPTR